MQRNHIKRTIPALFAVVAMTLIGVFGFNPAAHAAYAPTTTPTIQILNPDGSPRIDPNTGLAQIMPQVGTQLMVDLSAFPDIANTTFTYQWAHVNVNTGVITNIPSSGSGSNAVPAGTSRNAIPQASYVGQTMQVTITATNATSGVWTGTLTTGVVVGVNFHITTVPVTSASYISQFGDPSDPTSPNYVPPAKAFAFLTAYGWPDNTPPSDAISGGHGSGANITFPNQTNGNRGIHSGANGTGTYDDPITTATDPTATLWYGQEFYVPRVEKYFIVEDSCGACTRDMTGRGSTTTPQGTIIGPGSDGGPGLVHFDMYVGGEDGDFADVLACEDALTLMDSTTSPHMDPIIVNPGPNEPVTPYPMFNSQTGECNKLIDGSSTDPYGADIVGPYQSGKNVPATLQSQTMQGTGMCITDPGNSTVVGTPLTLEPCDSSRADQNMSQSGMYLIFNNLCVDMGDGMSHQAAAQTINGVTAHAVTLQRCNMNTDDQWNVNIDGTISAFNGDSGSLADLGPTTPGGTDYLWAVGSGQFAYLYWDNPATRGYPNTAPVFVANGSVEPGGIVSISGSGLTTMTADVSLVPAKQLDAVGVSLGTVTANADGTFSGDFTIPADTKVASYVIRVTGISHYGAPVPVDSATGQTTALTSTNQLVVSGSSLDNFAPVNRSVPIIGTSGNFKVAKASSGGGGTYTDTGGQVAGSMTPWIVLASLVCIGGALLLFRRQSVFGTARK